MKSPAIIYAAAFVQSGFAKANGLSYSDHAIGYLDRLEARAYDPDTATDREEKSVELPAEMETYSQHALGYLGRLQASKVFNEPVNKDGKQIYFGNEEEEVSKGIFTAGKDSLSLEEKQEFATLFDHAQEKECPLYTTVISFDNEFLHKHSIDYLSEQGQKELQDYARLGVAKLIDNCHLEHDNVFWTGAIHYGSGSNCRICLWKVMDQLYRSSQAIFPCR